MSYIDPSKRLKVPINSLNKQVWTDSVEVLEKQMESMLKDKIHGISFSPYIEGQSPAIKSCLTKEQISKRMAVIAPYVKWVRSFSCTDGNEFIPEIAKSYGLKTLVGAWIDDDLEQNELEINKLIEMAKKGHVDIAAIGNEVLLREELSVHAIIDYINRVKSAVPNLQVTYVDAYYLFAEHKELVDVCDVISANCYPFWEFCNLEYAIDYMRHMYKNTKDVACDKKVIISETGWPNKGSNLGGAIPSYENAMRYFLNTYRFTQDDNIETFYFSSFDESWKKEDEGECGASWGLWDKNEQFKFGKLKDNK